MVSGIKVVQVVPDLGSPAPHFIGRRQAQRACDMSEGTQINNCGTCAGTWAIQLPG